MLKAALAGVALIIVVCLTLPVLLYEALFGDGLGGGLGGCIPTVATSDLPTIEEWDTEQVTIAATIIDVGASRGVPPWGWVIAVATAMQESGLRNLPNLGANNDHDSIGVFQQRPSQGWGTPDQLADPTYQAGKFYDKLLTVPGWQSLPLTEAAQAVQASAYPDAYAKWSDDATTLVEQLTSTGPDAAAGDCISASGWTQPVHAPIVSGFRTPERPTHNGVDLGASRGTPIVAASAGTVIRVRCNVNPATHGCDTDGSPQVTGCGWYVDIQHAGGIITRYCHMLNQPIVTVGQAVAAGQVIGIVGSSGHSSRPHLHFEVHVNDDQSSTGAIDPVGYMRAVGATLGT